MVTVLAATITVMVGIPTARRWFLPAGGDFSPEEFRDTAHDLARHDNLGTPNDGGSGRNWDFSMGNRW